MTFCVCLFGLMMASAQNPPASKAIEKIEFRGLSRVSEDSVRAAIHARAGDVYDEQAIRRDFKALWDTGRFNDVQVKQETSERGGIIVRFIVTERAASIKEIKLSGLSRVPEDTART